MGQFPPFHTAAGRAVLKLVPMVEAKPVEGILAHVVGIRNTIAGRRDGASGTRFVTVCFSDVLGSTGSVVSLYHRQLAAGGPLTVTHPEMTRYFMPVREAVELVLQASGQGVEAPSAEAGNIYVLDVGEPVKIMDLAPQIIRLAGLQPDKDIEIEVTGLSPGEKLR